MSTFQGNPLNSPSRRRIGTTAARRLPADAPSTTQQNRSAAITSELHFGDLGVRRLTAVGRYTCVNALRA